MFGGLNTFPMQAYKQAGLLSGLKSKINLGAILTNTQKTLNIVNQAIPLVYQVKPMVENAKTIFKVMGAVKEENNNSVNRSQHQRKTNNTINKAKNNIQESTIKENTNTSNNPVFFI